MTEEQWLERRWAALPWRTPIPITCIGDGTRHYGCRFCIALHGLKGSQVPWLPTLEAVVVEHIAEAHPPAR